MVEIGIPTLLPNAYHLNDTKAVCTLNFAMAWNPAERWTSDGFLPTAVFRARDYYTISIKCSLHVSYYQRCSLLYNHGKLTIKGYGQYTVKIKNHVVMFRGYDLGFLFLIQDEWVSYLLSLSLSLFNCQWWFMELMEPKYQPCLCDGTAAWTWAWGLERADTVTIDNVWSSCIARLTWLSLPHLTLPKKINLSCKSLQVGMELELASPPRT